MSSTAPSSKFKHQAGIPPWLKGKSGILGILFIVCIPLNLAWTYFHWGGAQKVTEILNLISLSTNLLASAVIWLVVFQKSLSLQIRRAWLLLALSSVMLLIGNLIWLYLTVVLSIRPFPSISDAFYLAFYPLALWGFLAMPTEELDRRGKITIWLDLLSVLIAATMFVGYFIIGPTAATNNNDLLTQLIACAYPVGSLLLMGGILAVLYRRPSPDTRSALSLALIGMIFFLSSDFAFGYGKLHGTYTPGSWIDAGWNVAPLFFGLAALRQMVPGPASGFTTRWWILTLQKLLQWLPIAGIASIYGLVVYVVVLNKIQAAVWLIDGALVLTLLVVARQIISPAFADLPVRVKMILTFILVSLLSVILVFAMAYLTIRSNLEAVVGDKIKSDVEFRAQTLGSELSTQIDLLEGFALGETIEHGVVEANAHYTEPQTAIETQLQEQDVLHNTLARELDDFRDNFPDHNDLLLTDQHGATIAATTQPDNYSQASEEWWQSAYNQGRGAIYVGQPTVDPVTHDLQVIIAVPVQAAHAQAVIGVIRTIFRIQGILETLTPAHLESEVGFNLLLPDGQLIQPQGLIQNLESDAKAHLESDQKAHYISMIFEGESQLMSQARVFSSDAEDADAFKALNWTLIGHEKSAVASAPLFAVSQTTLLTLFFVFVLTTGIAVVLAQVLIAPISRLTGVAAQIAGGDFTTQAKVESKDEIGTLASTFNMMVHALSQTRQELEESESLYRSLVDYSPDMIAVHCDGKYVFINPAGVKLLGAHSVDELIGKNILDLIPEDGRDIVRKGIEYLTTSGEPTPLTQRKMYQMDGTSFDAEYRAISITYAGQPAIQLVARDITERKQAEEKIHQLLAQVARQRGDLEVRVAERTEELNGLNQRLKNELIERQQLVLSLSDSEERFRLLFEASPDAILLVDPHDPEGAWPIVDCNEVACAMNGYTREELIGHSVDLINTIPGHPAERAEYLGFLREQGVMHRDGVHRHKDGHIFPIEVSTSLISFAGRELVLGIDRDITERQRLTQSLQESEERFRLLFEASPDAIVLTDPNDPSLSWPIVDCNEVACRMNGFTRAELIGQSIDIIKARSDVGSEREEFMKQLREKGTLHYETMHKHRDGHLYSADVSTSLITIRGRELILGIDRDSTERKEAEDALNQAKDAAEEARHVAETANRAKSEFLSRMSHELRTPMNAILGFAQLLQMSNKDPLTSNQKERVRQIVNGGQHLLELINEILDISRIEANRVQISPEPVSIRESVQEVLDLTIPLALKRNIQIVTKLGRMDLNPFVMADRQRFKQVLLNILSNAVKYNYEAGSVILTCEQTPANRWRISVTDTGPGISQENIARLFTPFERLSSDQAYVEGTGLGLVLAKRLIELMHGQMGVESMLGRGSTFWIELPTAESQVACLQRTGVTKDLPALVMNARKILYVEDNVANYELIQQVLVDYTQIKLLWAADHKAGIELARQHRPNLILLDLHLGEGDGAEVLRQLKKDERTLEIPVVIVTADATHGQEKRLKALGAQAFLTKPLDVKQFVRLVEELLGEKDM